MRPAGAHNTLRLIDAEMPSGTPAGVVLARRDAAAVAERLAKRVRHYSSLRVTVFRDRLIFWSIADEVRLPWFGDDSVVYLTHIDKTLFFPADRQPVLPRKWAEAIADRLAAAKEVSRTLLLWPSQGRLTAVGLGQNSCRFAAVDWMGIAQP
jgi:hypothetical protein